MQSIRNKKIVLILVLLGGFIIFPCVVLLAAMFYQSVLNDGVLILYVNNYNEMQIEMYLVVPLILMLTFLNTLFSLNRVDRELKQLFRLKKTEHGEHDTNQKQDDEDPDKSEADVVK